MSSLTKQAGFAHIWLIAIVVILGISGAGYYVRQQQEKTQKLTKTDTASPDTSQTSQTLKPDQVTDDIRSVLTKQNVLLDSKYVVQLQEGEIAMVLEEESPPYKPAGYTFYTDYTGGSTLKVYVPFKPGYVNEKTTRKTIVSSYERLGLKYKTTYGSGEKWSGTDVYEGNGLVCTIDSPQQQSTNIAASCGEIDAYDSAAAIASPFALIIAEDNQNIANLYIPYPIIMDSKTPGYQKATVFPGDISGGEYAALFYKKGNEPWKFFSSIKHLLNCSEYNTQDLRNAFKDDSCYIDESATEAVGTVQ